MFCAKCGAEVSEGSDFCSSCGTPIRGGPPTSGSPSATSTQPVPETRPSVLQGYVAVEQGPPFAIRLLWFLLVGWWLGLIVVLAAWAANVTIVLLPVGLWLINQLPQIFTLRAPRGAIAYVQTEAGTVKARERVVQRVFWVRAVYFALVGWWFSLIWMLAAYVMAWTIVGLPLSFWMFDVSAAVTTLRRV